MATFKALNIESDDDDDIEVDNTKEIQIEEALKLYQDALKLHSEGARSYEPAAAAYRALFESEIFKYPESQSELKRLDLYGPPPEQDDLALDHEGDAVVGYTGATEENALGTLPQLIHLSQKNYAQFLLESLQHRIQHAEPVTAEDMTHASVAALDSFVESLDKDDTDPDLWRRTAAVGDLLGSRRIARYCLEAVLEGDDAGVEAVLSIPGLAETMAGQQLRQVVVKLQDELSLLQSPLAHIRKRNLSKLLKQRLSTYEAVAKHKHQQQQQQHPQVTHVRQPLRSILRPPSTWSEFGDHILRHAVSEFQGTGTNMPGLGIAFDLSGAAAADVDITMVDDSHVPPPPPHSLQVVRLSSLVVDQFVGMDDGKPTAPVPAFPIDSLHSSSESFDGDGDAAAGARLATRKRSSDAAGLQDAAEASRGRSKRVRARESNVDGSILEDETVVDTTQAEFALSDLDYVDNHLVDTMDKLFGQLHLPKSGLRVNDRKALRSASTKPDSEALDSVSAGGTARATLDIYHFLDEFSDSQARMLLSANTDLDSTLDTQVQPSGLSSLPGGQFKQDWPELEQTGGLGDFMQQVNISWLHINEVVFLWLSQFLSPRSSTVHPALGKGRTSYSCHKWPDSLKTGIVRVIVTLDDHVYRTLEDRLGSYDHDLLLHQEQGIQPRLTEGTLADVQMIQTLFELHLDVYSLIKEPNSGVDRDTVVTQGDRTDRWANLSRDAMNVRSSILDLPSLKDELNLRYLWAATHHINISGHVSREHTISCWQELRSIFVAVGSPVIELQNNAIMPHMSVGAIDRELSRLTTQDFFVKIFDPEQDDLAGVIESLEPLLELLHHGGDDTGSSGDDRRTSDNDSNSSKTLDIDEDSSQPAAGSPDYSTVASPELLNFLKNSNTSLRVSLWQRLREAYGKIEYQPMVVCCYFRIIELLVGELKSSSFADKPPLDRQNTLLKFLRLSHDLIGRILESTEKHEDALLCMDMGRIETGLGAILDLVKMLHSYTLFHDDIRVGLRQAPSAANGMTLRSFTATIKVMQEMQLHAWMIIYKLLGETMAQNPDKLKSADTSRFDFLRSVHNVLGARSLCGKFGRIFLKMLKQEYLHMRADQSVTSDYFDIEFAQVLDDLYGLKIFLDPAFERQDHHCQHETAADKHSAMQAVDLLLVLVSKMKMSDLLKHPIKDTIERVHALATRKKPSDAIMKNREVIRALLKSPINPSDLFHCVHGIGTLTLHPVPADHAILAAKGWYFLMGHIHLGRFRSQKRTGPTATDDLDIAVALFMQELEYSMDNWETWFRIAQAYDSKIEEHVSWSAEKLGTNAAEITQLEKAAIHCYRMAVALAMRSAVPGKETAAKLAELFADFAMRMYASTREPFGMQAFSLGDVTRWFSTDTLVKGIPFRPLQPYLAWKIARSFFKKAINLNPDKWKLHYNLAKCTWKMFSREDEARGNQQDLLPEDVTGEIIRAIELLPTKKDPKRAPTEPILEPHYKLVSVVHKMVMVDDLEPDEACKILAATPYAAKVDPVSERPAWEGYILKVLKNLRTADKSHWHHRMIARAANIVYHDGKDEAHILAAKHELSQQMFTKTMQLQIWKPENQRSGRHFVYSARYVRFFTHLLDQLNDRNSLDGLARRVRKRQADIFEHGTVWQEICQAFLRILRQHGNVPLGHETAVFSGINHEDFLRRKELLERWCQDPSSSSPSLDALQESLELKKINAGLMKAAIIDDLIGDAYAYLYDTVGRHLWNTAEAQEAEDRSRREIEEAEARMRDQQLQPPAPAAAVSMPSPARNPMMNLSHLMNIDGATDNLTPHVAASAVHTPTAGTVTPAESGAGEALAAPSRRKIGVGRREIRTCAEACYSKPSVPTIGATPGASKPAIHINARPDTSREVQVVIEGRSRPHSSSANGSILTNTGSRGDHITTAGASEADDGDDESELSEVDEELVTAGTPGKPRTPAPQKPRLMFPGLAKVPNASLVSSDIEEEDEGEGEEDDVENEGQGDEEGLEEEDGEEDEAEEMAEDDDDDEGDGDGEEEEDLAMGDAEDQNDDNDDEEGDGEEIMASSAAWHNQQARLAAAAGAGNDAK